MAVHCSPEDRIDGRLSANPSRWLPAGVITRCSTRLGSGPIAARCAVLSSTVDHRFCAPFPLLWRGTLQQW